MTEQEEFVTLLCRRIWSFLPDRTGHSVAQIELNPQFTDTKRILLETTNKYPHLISVLIHHTAQQLRVLNEDAHNSKVKLREERSLTTTLMLCRFLAEVLKEDWHRQKTHFNSNVADFEIVLNYSCFTYYDLPKPLNESLVSEWISIFVGLLSSNSVKQVLSLVKMDYSSLIATTQKKTISTAKAASTQVPKKPTVLVSSSSNATLVNQAINNGVVNLAKKVSTKRDSSQSNEADILVSPLFSAGLSSFERVGGHSSGGLNNSNSISPRASNKSPLSMHSTKASKHSQQSPPISTPFTQSASTSTSNSANNRLGTFSSSSGGSDNSNQISGDESKIESYIFELDSCVELILRYIATANPNEFYEFVHQKLFTYAEKNEPIPQQTLQTFCPLIKFMFFSVENSTRSAIDNLRAISFISNASLKLTFITFVTLNIRNQAFARPEDYAEIVSVENTDLENICKGLFDYVYQVLEDRNQDLPNTECSAFVQTWLCLLCINDFIEIEGGKLNKLRMTFNKRIKFLMSVIHDTEKLVNLESFSCLVNIFHVGARLKTILPNHPVHKFTIRYIDQTYDNLLKFSKDSKGYDESEHDVLVISMYLAALMLSPEKYIKILIQKFIEYKDNAREVKLMVKTIKGISESEKTTVIFSQVMKTLAVPLKSMIFAATQILQKHESFYQNHSTSSASIYSDILSIESDQVGSFNLGSLRGYNSIQQKLSTNLDDGDQDPDNISSRGSITSSHSLRQRVVSDTEEMLADLFNLFNAAPELYFIDRILMDDSNLVSMTHEELVTSVAQYASEVVAPLKLAFRSKSINNDQNVFDAACSLALTISDKDNRLNQNQTTVSVFADFLIAHLIVKSISEASLCWSVADPKFKAAFAFINDFMKKREDFVERIDGNDLLLDPRTAEIVDLRGGATQSIEKMLLLSLCTHDIQFYNIANISMKWYIKMLKFEEKSNRAGENLGETFERIVGEDKVFTGFVSLHKKVRSILRDAKPTKSLYQVWLVIYTRWLDMIETKLVLNEENLVFRHFTGFLVSTSGCFISESFKREDTEQYKKAITYISDFFDKCIFLLSSKDLVIRVIIKEIMSHESHSAVYHLITSKFINLSNYYLEKKETTAELVLFLEQALVIITSMIQVKNDGAFVLIACFRELGPLFFKIIDLAENINDVLKLKLRFSKLFSEIESDEGRFGVYGAIKVRNLYAKKTAEWLEKALFNDVDFLEYENSKELVYLNADMAHQCSRALSLQLNGIILEIPDGIKDSEVKKYKDLAFGNYFSIFYKIIQRFCADNYDVGSKSKHKINLIADNTLTCISNILQSDTDIGMQFVLPLGYHPNTKIRSLFLNVFSSMLTRRKSKNIEEFLDEVISQFTEVYPIYGSIAEEASTTEHNLLASALYGVFKYTLSLDKLFEVLLKNEIDHISRSTDIFRRNSTLTRLLSNFAKENGKDYLVITIRPLIQEIVDNSIVFEIEKTDSSDQDSEIFIRYFNKLVKLITDSFDALPLSLRFICYQIFTCVNSKFEESSLVAVGSFFFLRFICPAIVSPESFVDLGITDPKIRRSLMQLVKVLQNVANDSLGLLKWHALISYNGQLIEAKEKIYSFLKRIATEPIPVYPFPYLGARPTPELRYLHKFVYTYFTSIKQRYICSDPFSPYPDLQERVILWRKLDLILKSAGIPKSNVPLQINAPYKASDPNNTANSKFNEFMTKMSLAYIDQSDNVIIRNSIFADGTPVVVLNFRYLDMMNHDIQFMVYKLFEIVGQVWDNSFYMVYDFTEISLGINITQYFNLVKEYAPSELFKNCARVYYFNIPIETARTVIDSTNLFQKETQQFGSKFYVYSLVDKKEIINTLSLDLVTLSAIRDTRVVFNNAKLYLHKTQKHLAVNIRLGSQYFQICSEEKFKHPNLSCETVDYTPVEVYRLADITKCEVSSITNQPDEFTIVLNSGHQVTLLTSDRSEILRFLYFSTSRLAKTSDIETLAKDIDHGEHKQPWFGRLYNIVFQGLLCSDEEVKSSASSLFASLSTYFEIDFGIKTSHAKSISFPTNINDFVVSVSTHLAKAYPWMTYRFFKAFFENYEKFPEENKLRSIMFLTPWVENIYEHVYVANEESSEERVNQIVRQLSRLTMANKAHISFLNDYIWKKLFAQTVLLPMLVDEVVAFAIDNNTTDNLDWAFITAVISPSVEVCGEVVTKLISCVNNAKSNDSAIASRSKLFEIRVLVKICASLFFNSYSITRLYLADIFLLVALFIDNVYLDFGADLQKLMLNLIQSFLHKPGLTDLEQKKVDESIEYFSSQRAKMLFGVTREINSSNLSTSSDTGQIYNKVLNFKVLCDYLNDFISVLGNSEDINTWRSHWVMNGMEVAFASDSIFQARALLVVGILSQHGVVESIASKFLEIIATIDMSNLELTTSAAIATACLIEGLPNTSIIPSIMMWPQFCFGLLNHSAIYQASTTILVNSLIKITKSGGNYVDTAFDRRNLLEPYLTEFELAQGFTINRQNFDIHIFYVLTQGLKIAHFKHNSIRELKRYFEAQYESEFSDLDNIASVEILAFIYLSVTDKEFFEYLEKINLQLETVCISPKLVVPKVILELFLEDSITTKTALIQSAYLYSSTTVDSIFKARFLPIYSYLLSKKEDIGVAVYHIMKGELEMEFINSTSIEIVSMIAQISLVILLREDYVTEKYADIVDQFLTKNKINILRRTNQITENSDFANKEVFQSNLGHSLKRLQAMIHRASYAHVEGQFLEE